MFDIVDTACASFVSLIVPCVGMRLVLEWFRICIFHK